MTAAVLDATCEQATGGGLPALRILVLARAACEDGITRAELARDLACVAVSGAVSGAASGSARVALDVELAALVRADLVSENRSRFKATECGVTALATEFGAKIATRSWLDLRDQRLTAKALGLAGASPARCKALVRPDQLRAEILGARYGFKVRGAASVVWLRSELALVALERAFGNTMKSAVSARSGFNAKTARLLACQLLANPRDVGTDSRLVAQLAAEAVGASKPDADQLRFALLRKFASGAGDAAPADAPLRSPSPRPKPAAPRGLAASRPAAASRPDLTGFASAVNAAAGGVADGWPGNRKAMVCRVWQAIAERHPGWGLSEIEFKAMLAEAHRTGHLVLATADLKNKGQLRELQASAISYKNTVWHLVRVQD